MYYVKVNSFGKTKKNLHRFGVRSPVIGRTLVHQCPAKRRSGDGVRADHLQDDDAVSPFPQVQSVPGSTPTRKRTFRNFLQQRVVKNAVSSHQQNPHLLTSASE
jgi:hypothetical protein